MSTIAVPNPEGVDTAAVAKELPYGTVTGERREGRAGNFQRETGRRRRSSIANAAVIVSLDDGK